MQTVETNFNQWKLTDDGGDSFQLVKQISEHHYKIIECVRYSTGKCALQVSDFDWDEDDFKSAYDENCNAYGFECSYDEYLEEYGCRQYIAEWVSELSFGENDSYTTFNNGKEFLDRLLLLLDEDDNRAMEILSQLFEESEL